jgi:drug/metabolite transporter (DMT)-like permease
MQWWALLLLSAVALAVGDILRKQVLQQQHPLEQLAAEGPFRLLMMLILVPFVGLPDLRTLALVFGASLLLLATLFYRNKSFRHLPISTVAPMHNLSPVILLLLAAVILGERPTGLQIAGILFIALGGYAVELKGRQFLLPLRHMAANPYSAVVAISLVLMSLMAMVDKMMLTTVGIDIITYLFWLYLFLTVLSTGANYAMYNMVGVVNDIRRSWLWLLLISACGLLNVLFMFKALAIPGVLVSLAIPIRRTSTLISTVFGGRLFHEQGVWRKSVGCGVMMLGLLFIV